MSKRFFACVLGSLAMLLALGATTAAADTPPGVQTVDQSATSGQQATAASGAAQIQPSNTNIAVRVLSPGDSGSVNQTNTASSTADATNANATGQTAAQDQSGAGGIQTSNQSAANSQLAAALSQAVQLAPTNKNLSVRVGSDGNDGSVKQTNGVSSDASSTNTNGTWQNADQSQAGGSPCGCAKEDPSVQTSDQSAESAQKAIALSKAEQKDATNVNLPIRVGSSGGGGSVTQSNEVDSAATARNTNDTKQSSDQSQAGGGSGTGVQTAKQSADNEQAAAAASSATQVKPKNVNISVRVLSPGNDGSVTQTNSVSSSATAKNENGTSQSIAQDPSASSDHGCGCGATGIQTAKQVADSKQAALSLSKAEQVGAVNKNAPVRVGSLGNDGSVWQSNDVSSESLARNGNDTHQDVDQGSHGSVGTGVQVAYQSASNAQLAAALSAAEQRGASNHNSPLRVLSPGSGGRVAQSNDVSSAAEATNDNRTWQDADQDLLGDRQRCGCDAIGIQALGQKSESKQGALAASKAVQDFGRSECGCQAAGNSNAPVRVWSGGDDGSVAQSNSVGSSATAGNRNSTWQSGDQSLAGASGIGIQALGQQASNEQAAAAFSLAFQLGARNHNGPVRVHSPGGGGSVTQANSASSKADARNDNYTTEKAGQTLRGSHACGCGEGIGVQALGQSAWNGQLAAGLSAAAQLAPKNASGGSSVGSPGYGGSTYQSNDDSSAAGALNRDWATMFATQDAS